MIVSWSRWLAGGAMCWDSETLLSMMFADCRCALQQGLAREGGWRHGHRSRWDSLRDDLGVKIGVKMKADQDSPASTFGGRVMSRPPKRVMNSFADIKFTQHLERKGNVKPFFGLWQWRSCVQSWRSMSIEMTPAGIKSAAGYSRPERSLNGTHKAITCWFPQPSVHGQWQRKKDEIDAQVRGGLLTGDAVGTRLGADLWTERWCTSASNMEDIVEIL